MFVLTLALVLILMNDRYRARARVCVCMCILVCECVCIDCLLLGLALFSVCWYGGAFSSYELFIAAEICFFSARLLLELDL